jgi:hypothetical protein
MRWSPPPRAVTLIGSFYRRGHHERHDAGWNRSGKHSFHLHGQSGSGKQTLRKKVTRKQLLEFFVTAQACTVVMEACAGAHYMARTLAAFGHTVKLISPQFVRPFVKTNKNDFVDAEAICEAAVRPAMRFVTPKTEAQQTLSALHRVRESLVQDRVKTVNQLHGFLLEFNISLPAAKLSLRVCPSFCRSIRCHQEWRLPSNAYMPTSSILASGSPRWTRKWVASLPKTISASA